MNQSPSSHGDTSRDQNEQKHSSGASTVEKEKSKPTDQTATALTRTIGEGAGEVAGEVKHLAGDLVDRAKKTAEDTLAGGKDRAAEELENVANALRQTSDHLRVGEKGVIPDYVARAADGVDAASEYLQARSFGQIVSDIEGFARREPALFLGGAFLVGLVGGRFLKSSGSIQKPMAADDMPQRSGAV